jgi:riboflavin synthase alpha subunit
MTTLKLFLRGASLTLLLLAVERLRMRCIRHGLRYDMAFLQIEAGIQLEIDRVMDARRQMVEQKNA